MTNDVQIEIPVGKFGNLAFFKDPMNIFVMNYFQIIREKKSKRKVIKKKYICIY